MGNWGVTHGCGSLLCSAMLYSLQMEEMCLLGVCERRLDNVVVWCYILMAGAVNENH